MTPEARRAESDRRCTRHGQGATLSKRLGRGAQRWTDSTLEKEGFRDCAVKESLKDLISTTYTNKMHIFFGSSILKTSKLSVLDLEQRWDGWPPGKFSQGACEWEQSKLERLMLLCWDSRRFGMIPWEVFSGSMWVRTKQAGQTRVSLWGQLSNRRFGMTPWKVFSGSVWVRTKYAGKTRVDLWGQSSIWDVTQGIWVKIVKTFFGFSGSEGIWAYVFTNVRVSHWIFQNRRSNL